MGYELWVARISYVGGVWRGGCSVVLGGGVVRVVVYLGRGVRDGLGVDMEFWNYKLCFVLVFCTAFFRVEGWWFTG